MEKNKKNKWEYLERYDLTKFDMGELGRVGWELVSVVRIDGENNFLLYLLKRPLDKDNV